MAVALGMVGVLRAGLQLVRVSRDQRQIGDGDSLLVELDAAVRGRAEVVVGRKGAG